MNKIIRVNRQKLIRLDRVVETPRICFKGRYKIEVMHPDGKLKHSTGWFDNLITNLGLDLFGQGGGYLGSCVVGSGNATPAVTDTTLQTFVAGTGTQVASTGSAQPSAPYFGTRTITYQFGQGVAAGNLAEVGVGTDQNHLWSRALILDGSGNPTTLTVLNTEFLNVTYQLQQYPITTDITGTVTIAGVPYNYTARPGAVTSNSWIPAGDNTNFEGTVVYDGVIGAVTAQPAGTASGATSVAQASYSNGSHQQNAVGTWSLTAGNFTLPGGVKSISWSNGVTGTSGFYQVGLDDGSGHGIPKDNTKVMTLSIQINWGRGPT